MNKLEKIKRILDSEAGVVIDNKLQPANRKVVDNRFFLVKQNIELFENKDTNFYSKLIELIAIYIDKYYTKEIKNFLNVVFDENGELMSRDCLETNYKDVFLLTMANWELAGNLFDFVCSILENNKDVKINIETLNKLLNRDPKLFSFTAEESYLYRPLDYKKLVKIINQNKTLEKSNISIDDIYRLLLDTCQLNNEDVFCGLISPEQFNKNHQKIDEILMCCNAKAFVEITNIIKGNFNETFDRFSIAKKRNKNRFCEGLIFELISCNINKDDFDLIHKILTDPELNINYNSYFMDYAGGGIDLRSKIAFSSNKVIIKDLLSKEQNIQNYYGYGVYLYQLYAIIGEYDKALTNFEEIYNFKNDIQDEESTWDKVGYAYGGWGYKDSLANFISKMYSSFKEEGVDYSIIVNLINRIINSKNVKYINIEKVLTSIQEVLTRDDFKLLIDNLLKKHNSGKLEFIMVKEHKSMFTSCIISIASEEEFKNSLLELNKKEKSKALILNLTK